MLRTHRRMQVYRKHVQLWRQQEPAPRRLDTAASGSSGLVLIVTTAARRLAFYGQMHAMADCPAERLDAYGTTLRGPSLEVDQEHMRFYFCMSTNQEASVTALVEELLAQTAATGS